MTLETATYINQLNASYPEGGADRSTADDHLRLIKSAVKATFPSITGPVTVTHSELNLLTGVSETVGSKLVQFSLSISGVKTEISLLSLSVSQINTSINSISNTVSVINARVNTLSASVSLVQADVARISQTVSVAIARINTLSASVSLVQADVARISQTVSVAIARINTLSASVVTIETRINTLSASVSLVQSQLVNMTGAILAFAMVTPPSGWLECNGTAVSRTTYSNLFTAIGTTFGTGDGSTTFNLPQLQGEFIRGYDNGRGVDSGRTFGSAQVDSFKSHSHLVYFSTSAQPGSGANTLAAVGAANNTPSGDTGGTETRPRNIALLYCIKY